MRILPAVLLALLLAGCATPGPADDASAGRASFSCPAGQYVTGFDAAGTPACAAALAAATCPAGQAVVGIDAGGRIVCGILAPTTPAPAPSPARSISITSSGALQSGVKSYTIASASAGMAYGDLAFTINGATRTLDAAGACPASPSGATTVLACAGSTRATGASRLHAGDTIAFGGISSGDTLRILDAQANAVMLTLTIG